MPKGVGTIAIDVRAKTFVGFELDGERYAVPLSSVKTATRMVAVTPLPETPAWFAGVISWHGKTTPVFDLRPILELPPMPVSMNDRLLFVHRVGRTCALIVGKDVGVFSVPFDALDPVSQFELSPRPVCAVVGSSDAVHLVLDLDRLFESVSELIDDQDTDEEGGGYASDATGDRPQ